MNVCNQPNEVTSLATEIEGVSRITAEIPLTPEGDTLLVLANGERVVLPGRWESIEGEGGRE